MPFQLFLHVPMYQRSSYSFLSIYILFVLQLCSNKSKIGWLKKSFSKQNTETSK